jgi:hypothetical protein
MDKFSFVVLSPDIFFPPTSSSTELCQDGGGIMHSAYPSVQPNWIIVSLLVSTPHHLAPQATIRHPPQFVASDCGGPGGTACEERSMFLSLQHLNEARSSLKGDQDLPPQASQKC